MFQTKDVHIAELRKELILVFTNFVYPRWFNRKESMGLQKRKILVTRMIDRGDNGSFFKSMTT